MENSEPMTTYDDWKTTDPNAEFLGDAEQEDSEAPATRKEEVIPLSPEDFVLIGDTAKECVARPARFALWNRRGTTQRVYLAREATDAGAAVAWAPFWQC
jgi:hypothetical protein